MTAFLVSARVSWTVAIYYQNGAIMENLFCFLKNAIKKIKRLKICVSSIQSVQYITNNESD